MKDRLLLAVLVIFGLSAFVGPTEASAQFFGRNKVQYRAFDFDIIRTAHFDLHYYEQEREAALDAARMAERAYARLSHLLQHDFEERRPIILYASHADFQQTNATHTMLDESTGAFAETLKGRVVIPLTGSYAEFDHVLRHELVHSFQHDIMFRSAAMDNVNPFANRLPLWFTEGMAEYLSIGHIDAITAAWLRDATLSGYMRSIGEMNMRDDYLSYRFGQALWAYIGSKWGDEVVGVLLQRATRIGLEPAFQATIGMSLAELDREWTDAVRKTYLPRVTEFQRPEAFASPVLRHARIEDPSYLAPAISADGTRLALFTARDGFFPDLWLADARTGEFQRKIVSSNQESNFESLRYSSSAASFSPDGRYLAFSAQTGGRDALYIYDLERNRMHRKLEYELNAIMKPTWSPDGRRIAFSGLDGGLSDLFITDLDGNLQRLTDDRYADLFPSWSPDGSAIAFSTDRAEGTDFDKLSYDNLRIALYHIDDGSIEILPHQEAGRNLNAAWAPDNRSLVWVGDRTGIKNLYLFDRDTNELSMITDLLSGIMGPTATDMSPVLDWARNDSRLVFVYFEAAGHSIYAVDDPRTLPRTPVAELKVDPNAAPVAMAAEEPAEVPRLEPDTLQLPRQPPVTDSVVTTAPEATVDTTVAAAAGIASSSYYREGDTFRPSSTLPAGTRAEEPVSVIAMLDSAEFALPDTTDFEFIDYNVSFSPDIIGRPTVGAQVGGYYGNGLYGGSFISLSDMLGNHNITVAGSVNGSFSDAMFYGGYNFLKNRANIGTGIMQQPLYRYYGGGIFEFGNDGDVVAADVFMRDVIRSAQGIVSYPFSTFRRMEFGVSGVSIKRDQIFRGVNLTRGEPLDHHERIAEAKYLEPMAALVFDNSLFGWTGPVAGRRYRIQASHTVGDFNYSEGLIDFRNYWNYKQKVVLATRLVSLTRLGTDADRFGLYWGGPYYLRGYDGDSFDLNSTECQEGRDGSIAPCPVRDQLIGSSAAMLNVELRFPVVTELQVGFLGNFPPIDAVVFFDGGLAWDNAICTEIDPTRLNGCAAGASQDVKLVWNREEGQDPYIYREPLYSYGLGLRINVFYTVLRLDYAFPLSRPDRGGRFSFSFGPSF